MKKIYVLLFILMILCVGCKAEYTLTINEDLTVEEKVIALENKEFYDRYYKSTVPRVIDVVMTTSKDYLEENNYKVDKILSEESGVSIEKKYDTLEEYSNSSEIYTQLLPSFEYKKNNNIIILNAEGDVYKGENSSDKYVVNEAVVNIKLPFRVINNNADSVNRRTNTYTWNISNDTEYKKIYLEFDSSKKPINYDKIFLYITSSLLVAGIIMLIVYFIKKKNSSNEI